MKWAVDDVIIIFWKMRDVFYHLQNTYIFCVRMCCKKRTVYLNTVQEYTMALSCVMTSSVIFLKSYMSKSICTETKLLKQSSETQVWLTISLLLPTHFPCIWYHWKALLFLFTMMCHLLWLRNLGMCSTPEYGGGCKVKCAVVEI